MQDNSNAPKIAGAIVISAVVLIGAFLLLTGSEDTGGVSVTAVETSTPVATEAESSASEPLDEATASSTYVDGSYSVSGTYRVPEGHTEPISVTIELANDIVVSLAVQTTASNGESEEHQSRFDPLIQGEVEGQDLDDADVSRLGGASLTSGAFNDLLEAIRTQARS